MTDTDFIKFVEDMDRCWREGRFHDLGTFLADDIVIVAPDGKTRLEGIAAAVASYREFTVSSLVEHYVTSNNIVTLRGDTAVIEYQWNMAWTGAGVDYNDAGREILVLTSREGGWRVIWRTQIPAMR
jgi:ketosteroid isomerase-like protein